MNKKIIKFFITAILVAISINSHARDVHQETDVFLKEVFAGAPPKPSKVWIKKELKGRIRAIMGHDLDVLRLRYWRVDGRSVWILEEIGKEQPITAGIVIEQGKIESVRVLVFRESRGWEVRYPFFTDQFKGTALARESELDKNIDGISGATLSVNALIKMARLALLLDQYTTPVAEAAQ